MVVFNLILGLLPTAILLLSFQNEVLGYSFYPPVNPVLDPDLAIDLKRPRTFNVSGIFGTNTLQTNVAVMNRSVVANSVVAVMLTSIAAYHFLYHLEDGPFSKDSLGLSKESSTTSDPGLFDYLIPDLGALFGVTSKSDEDDDDEKAKKKAKKSRKDDSESCDCESYCTNKYYYGDGNYDPQDYSSSFTSTSYYDQNIDQESSRKKRAG